LRAGCHRDKSSSLIVEESSATDQHRAGTCLDDGRKGGVEFGLSRATAA
jgi:hypothetical protein